MTAYITRYSMDDGIIMKAEVDPTYIPDVVTWRGTFLDKTRGEWFTDAQAAHDHVQFKRDDIVDDLQSEAIRLDNLTFVTKDASACES